MASSALSIGGSGSKGQKQGQKILPTGTEGESLSFHRKVPTQRKAKREEEGK